MKDYIKENLTVGMEDVQEGVEEKIGDFLFDLREGMEEKIKDLTEKVRKDIEWEMMKKFVSPNNGPKSAYADFVFFGQEESPIVHVMCKDMHNRSFILREGKALFGEGFEIMYMIPTPTDEHPHQGMFFCMK